MGGVAPAEKIPLHSIADDEYGAFHDGMAPHA